MMKLRSTMSAFVFVVALAATANAQVVNGSFESGLAGWTVTGGTATTTAVADCLFPSAGASYLRLDSGSTGPGVAGYGPHAAGTCGQITQVVTRPLGQFCALSFDWEFLERESLPSASFNDFMSVDVINNSNNTLIANALYIDTGAGAGAPPYTNVPGAGAGVLTYVPSQSGVVSASGNQAPAGFKRALVDLSSVAPGTPMRIEISVCNGGDGAFTSTGYIDRVRLSGGQQNFNSGTAALRVLGSSHVDGSQSGGDWGGDFLGEAPYTLRACPGQRLSFRAFGVPGTKWAMVAGSLLDPGLNTTFGQINVDVFFGPPFTFVVNGFAPDPVSAWIGTMTSTTNWIDAQIPEGVPAGSSITVQAGMEQSPGGAIAVSAATTIDVGPPQIPVGAAVLAGGAQNDDGSTNLPFAGFGGGSWPFYGVARPDVNVNSNGNMTFVAGDSTFGESETQMLTGNPRIAPVWDDLYPPAGGSVRSTTTGTTVTVSWTGIAEYFNTLHGNNFAVQMYQANGPVPAGAFTIYYASTTMDDGLAGISPGGLPAPAANSIASNVNWSSTGASFGSRGSVAAGGAKFEKFAQADNGLLRDKFDLMTIGGLSRITFVPNGTGYTYFVGTR